MLDQQQPSLITTLCIQKNMELINSFENQVVVLVSSLATTTVVSNSLDDISICIETLRYWMINFNVLNRNHVRSKPNRR